MGWRVGLKRRTAARVSGDERVEGFGMGGGGQGGRSRD